MKLISRIIFTFLLLFTQSVFAQSRQTKNFINEVRRTVKKESIVKDNIDWSKLNNDIKSIPFTGNHNVDKELVYSVFISSLKKAGDKHSLFLSNELSGEIKKQNTKDTFTTSKLLGSNIGYLKIPHCFTFDYQMDLTFADTIVKQIETLDKYAIDKWIIDLRGNTGGNVWPMLSGLAPIIGEGLVGYTVKNQNTTKHMLSNGKINHSTLKTTIYRTKHKFKKI